MASSPKLRVRGLAQAMLRLDVLADLENAVAVQAVMLEAAKMVTDEVHDNIDERDSELHGFTSGRIGTVGASARARQQWRPHTITVGERKFNVKPGDLKAAVQHRPLGRNGAMALIDFYTAPHAWYLEFGFKLRDGTQYPAEGFFARAVQTTKRDVSAYVRQRMIELLRRYSVDDPEGLFAGNRRRSS